MIVFCSLTYLTFLLVDIIPIVKSKQWKVMIIYSTLIITAYTFTVLNELGVKIPSPSDPIRLIVTSIFGK